MTHFYSCTAPNLQHSRVFARLRQVSRSSVVAGVVLSSEEGLDKEKLRGFQVSWQRVLFHHLGRSCSHLGGCLLVGKPFPIQLYLSLQQVRGPQVGSPKTISTWVARPWYSPFQWGSRAVSLTSHHTKTSPYFLSFCLLHDESWNSDESFEDSGQSR